MATLEIAKIEKQYKGADVLKGVDLALEDGGFLVLLGASGCGKSTLLNIIAGLTEPTSGDILLDGRSIRALHPKHRDIAMVFQSYALYPNLSVARNMGFPLEMRRVPREERERAVSDVARLLQIEQLLDRKPAQLSGGQRQRVAIGRALVRKPKLFLFDEPLSNLDARLRAEMRHELKRLHSALGTTIVYVTHDQVEAMTLATKLVLMHGGKIEQQGTPAEIYGRPRSMRVADFVGSPPMNFIQGHVADGRFRAAKANLEFAYPGSPSLGNVVIGIRPESLWPTDQSSEQIIRFTADLTLVELTGPELLMSARVGGHDILVSAPASVSVTPGQSVTLGVAPTDIHYFSAEPDGRRL